MYGQIYVKSFPEPELDRREILRYAGVRGESTPEIDALAESCIDELGGKLSYKVCYRELSTDLCDLPELAKICKSSRSLQKNLEGCHRMIIFGATVGLLPDRLTAKYSAISPARAAMLQAVGAERIEALCDAFCEDIRKSGVKTKPRFSAGYGDLPLSAQKHIFALLDCERKIGLTLNESLLMSPTKSVTAIVGIMEP